MEIRRAELMENGKMTIEQVDQQIKMGIKYFWFGFIFIFIMNLIIGFILSLISGLILKKAKSTY